MAIIDSQVHVYEANTPKRVVDPDDSEVAEASPTGRVPRRDWSRRPRSHSTVGECE
jgi:hypothetical protein